MPDFVFVCRPRTRGRDLAMIAKRANEKAGDKAKVRNDNDSRSKSEPAKRSLTVRGRKTDLRLEDALWNELRAMADERKVSVSELLNGIDIERKRGDLSSAIRLFVSSVGRQRR